MRAGHRQAFFEAIFARDGGRCAYCGVPVLRRRPGLHRAADLATLDHVVPKSRGGPLTAENVVLACRGCNTARGTQDPQAFRARRSGAWADGG
ncbi:MAG TPA: HNH endonuclease signature motif containing protein [Microvirga sp.]|jgi:5-methylcytosine-specific restriction endonuclease McrA|nr:HNH endonuclease signature motif containing protein [Microvirga sp.]